MPKEDTQFKKGEINNPNGRPKDSFSILTILKRKLQECPKGEDKRTYAERIVQKLLDDAERKGDTQMRKIIFNYIEGMPAQKMDLTSGGEKIIPIYNGLSIQGHNSDKEDIQPEEEDKGSVGGDISK